MSGTNGTSNRFTVHQNEKGTQLRPLLYPDKVFMFKAFKEIFDNLPALVGKQVSLSGQLLIGEADIPFLAVDYAAYKCGERLPLADKKLIAKHLLSSLPAYGGGDVICNEQAFVIGTIVAKESSYELVDIRYCKIIRDEFEIIVSMGSE